jgi:hypothetical protein
MTSDINKYINEFDKNLQILIDNYKNYPDDYFFTEKELHAHFYHLCLGAKFFLTKRNFNLIHTEYPTPFKCEKLKNPPYIKYAGIKDDKVRSHLDLVLLNPNFVDWIRMQNKDIKYITGLTNGLYSNYILDYSKVYKEFEDTYKEPILLYALEFKFLRHSISGTKYPIQEILYDIEKLKLLREFDLAGVQHYFCAKTLSIVFIGKRNSHVEPKIRAAIPAGSQCRIVAK